MVSILHADLISCRYFQNTLYVCSYATLPSLVCQITYASLKRKMDLFIELFDIFNIEFILKYRKRGDYFNGRRGILKL